MPNSVKAAALEALRTLVSRSKTSRKEGPVLPFTSSKAFTWAEKYVLVVFEQGVLSLTVAATNNVEINFGQQACQLERGLSARQDSGYD